MRAAKRWILWRPEVVDGKEQKKPVYPCNAKEPKTWLTFEQALREAEARNAEIGFVLGQGFCGIDLRRLHLGRRRGLFLMPRKICFRCRLTLKNPQVGSGLHAIINGTISEP